MSLSYGGVRPCRRPWYRERPVAGAALDEANALTERLSAQVTELQQAEREAEQTTRRAEARLESAEREAEQYKSLVEKERRQDLHPEDLGRATLAESLGAERTAVAVVQVDDDGGGNLAQGALLEYLKQEARLNCGFSWEDSADIAVSLSVTTVTSSGVTAMSVELRLIKMLKIPGESLATQASLWTRHTVGQCGPGQAPAFSEEILDSLLDSLASALAP